MASISTDKANGTRTIQFVAGDGKRRSIRLGKVSQKHAETVRLRIEALVACAAARVSWDADTAAWVATIGNDLAERLSAAGLIPRRAEATLLGSFLDDYFAKRPGMNPGTRLTLGLVRKRLIERFGESQALANITTGDVKDWVEWMRNAGYAEATVGSNIKKAKQFFAAAVDHELIARNPFAKVKAPQQVNRARMHYVDRARFTKLLEACPPDDHEWKLILALARYGGLRTPSETLGVQWSDVLWDRNRFYVRSPKTERYAGKEGRYVPIFPELLPFLRNAFEAAPEGTNHVVMRLRHAEAGQLNWRTKLLKLIYRAGLTPWQRLFQNLRASCEQDLCALYPLPHVVCWLGHTERVAMKHYVEPTDADFEHAASAANSGAAALQIPVQSAADKKRQRPTVSSEVPSEREVRRLLSDVVACCPYVQVSPTGLEPSDVSTFPDNDFRPRIFRGAAQSGAVTELLAALRSLPEADRLTLSAWLSCAPAHARAQENAA